MALHSQRDGGLGQRLSSRHGRFRHLASCAVHAPSDIWPVGPRPRVPSAEATECTEFAPGDELDFCASWRGRRVICRPTFLRWWRVRVDTS